MDLKKEVQFTENTTIFVRIHGRLVHFEGQREAITNGNSGRVAIRETKIGEKLSNVVTLDDCCGGMKFYAKKMANGAKVCHVKDGHEPILNLIELEMVIVD